MDTAYSKCLKVFTFCMVIGQHIIAQTPTYFKGTGTGTNTIPMNTAGSHCQQIYLPSDFNTIPISGVITKIYFRNSTAAGSGTYTNFSVSFLQNSLTAFPNTTFLTGFTNALSSSSITINGNAAVGGWYEILLATPFLYDNSQTLIVEIKYDSKVGGMSGYTTTATGNKRLSIITAPGPATGNLSTLWGDFGMEVIPASVCTSPPTPGTSSANPSAPVCSGVPVALNLTGHSLGSGQSYVWQSSLTMIGGYTDISSSSSSSNFNINPSVTKYYRAAITCGANTTYSTPVQVVVNPGFPAGTYTINSNLATGGTNYQTFTEAVNALSCGINGSVIFNVAPASGPYVEQIIIPQIYGATATSTITINGNGQTLIFNSTNTSSRAGITLNGADYLTINNLIIDGSSGTYGWGILFTNAADHNVISGCTILTSISNTTSANHCPIVMSNSSTSAITSGNNGNYNTISGNTLSGGYYSVTMYGNSTTGAQNLNNVLTNNIIEDSYTYSVYVLYQSGAVISRNNISRPKRTSTTTIAGVYFSTGNINCIIEQNKVHDMFAAISGSTATIYCFYVAADGIAGQENKLINNLVYNINSNGPIYGIYNTTAPYMQAYHNTIVLNDIGATAGTTYGLYQTGVSAGIVYRDNIVVIGRAGTGAKRCIYFVTTTSTIICNNNDLFITSNVGGADNAVGQWGATNYASLLNWRTANSNAFDQQSFDLDPTFVNAGSGNFAPDNGLLDNKGVNVGVNTDINGIARSATVPDVGAYEFSSLTAGLNLADEALVAPAVTTTGCYTNDETVTIRIRNASTSTINFSINPVTITTNITGPVNLVISATVNSGTLGSDQFMNVPMNQRIDMSPPGVYIFNSSLALTGDVNPSNDAMPQQTRTKVSLAVGAPTVSPGSYCLNGGSPVLTAAGATGYSNLQWQQSNISGNGYANISGGITTPFTVPGLITQTMYYRLVSTCGTTSSTSSELSVILNNPQITSTTPGSHCGPGTVDLSATGSAGTTINWYTASSGGVPLLSGNNFTTPGISTSTTYYVAAQLGSGSTSQLSLMPFAGGNGCGGGEMFNVTPAVNLSLTEFITNLGAAVNTAVSVNIWYKTGTYLGFETNAAAWTLHQTVMVNAAGPNNGSSIVINPLSLNAGQQYAIFINADMDYTNITSATFFSNADVSVELGAGLCGQFTGLNALRGYNGSIKYTAGCSSLRVPVMATIDPGYSLAGSQGGAAVCATADVGAGITYLDGSCKSILNIVPNGASPVSGSINACVKIDATVQTYNSGPYVQRHYDIVPAINPANATARITLYFTQQEFNNFNTARGAFPPLPVSSTDNAGKANLRITQYHGTGNAPGNYNGATQFIDPADADIIYNNSAGRWEVSFNVTGFSGFYVHSGFQVLPIALLNFTAQRNGKVNELNWTTSQEINGSHFAIERSSDAINFREIGQVRATGNSVMINNYLFTDVNPVKGINYYRLKVVDIDNKWRNTNVLAVKNSTISNIYIYPNPVKELVHIDMDVQRSGQAIIMIFDLTGKKLLEHRINVTDGTNLYNVSVSRLASGTYTLKVILEGENLLTKFTKL